MSTASALPHVSSLQPVAVKNMSATAPQRNLAIGYLRAFITVLVLAHHAALAYCTFVPKPAASLNTVPPWWTAFPIADSARFPLFDLLVGFNDAFFMALMFLLSGLFVWSSLTRKGSGTFLKDRVLRLGVPFVVAAGLIAPLAYYPSYLQTGASGVSGYWHQWRSLGNWPAGPAWFVWVLLAFDCVATGIFVLAPNFGHFTSPIHILFNPGGHFSSSISADGTQVQCVLLERSRPVLCADRSRAPLLLIFPGRDRLGSLRHQSWLTG